MFKLLSGVRVLDLSHTLAGPFATMVLADLGADVIKVEPLTGDETRTWAPLVGGESAYFMSINRGKRSIAVNLKSPRGKEVVYRLAKRCDVVVENFRPGVPERLGVDYDSMLKANPKIVYCSIKGFGRGSPYAGRPAYDIVLQALSGLMMTTGREGDPPVRVSFALFDVITGLIATTYIASALYSGRRPSYIEVSMYDASVFSMVYVPLIYLLTGREPPRMGSAHPSIVPYQAFEDSTGRWFIVAAANDRLWESMCRALGREDLTRNPKYSSNPARVANREELVGKLQKLFKQRPREYWMELLDRAGVPTAPVYRLSEVFRDPHIKGSGLEVDIQHPRLGKVEQLAEPALINGVRPIARTPPPLLGQHTEEVLKELNYSDEEIEAMRKEGVIL